MVSFRALSAVDAAVPTDNSEVGDVKLLRGIGLRLQVDDQLQTLQQSNPIHLRIVLWVGVSFVRNWDKFFLTSEFLKKAGTNLASTDPDRPRFSELFRNARGTSLSSTTCLPILQYSTLQSCSMIILMSKCTRHRVLLSQFHLHLHYHSLLTLMQ